MACFTNSTRMLWSTHSLTEYSNINASLMWPRFWLFLLSKNSKWEYLGTKHEEINIYLSCVPEGIFPWYISSADWETVGSWPRLATASTLSSLERSCDCDVGHMTDIDHVPDVDHVTVMWVMWLWHGSCDCDVWQDTHLTKKAAKACSSGFPS